MFFKSILLLKVVLNPWNSKISLTFKQQFIMIFIIVVDFFSLSFVFTFLFYKHLLLFFLLSREKFGFSVVFTVSILFTFGITEKFLFIICLSFFSVYVLCVCFLKILRWFFSWACVQYASEDDETLFIIHSDSLSP